MKNILKLLGVIALVAVIGFAMAACDSDSGSSGNSGGGGSGSISGQWFQTPQKTGTPMFDFKSGNVLVINGMTEMSYKYSVSNNKVTVTLEMAGTSSEMGTFTYSISGNEMTIATGTVMFKDMGGETFYK